MDTYAIGDVHGRLDLLLIALDKIETDAPNGARIVCLGDYVDRGPDSKGVIDLLSSGPRRECDELICLKGNHEDLMLRALQGDSSAENCWLGNGGLKALQSYYPNDPPAAHIEWLSDLPLIHEDARRIYVHAGLMPGYGSHEQDEEWVLWIRDRFLRADNEWGKHVVHGHTPQWDGKPDPAAPELLQHRTNLDTAGFFTGVLTVGVFSDDVEGGPVRVLTAEL